MFGGLAFMLRGLTAGNRTTTVCAMNVSTQAILREFKDGLCAIYRGRLDGCYLFGSYARGEADAESDVDILVVLDDFERYGAEVDRTSELASVLSLKYNVSISVAFLKRRDWQRGETPFILNVRDEAIAA
jgi:predicted nucleotidyltransferase